jgi:hypothetical protein
METRGVINWFYVTRELTRGALVPRPPSSTAVTATLFNLEDHKQAFDTGSVATTTMPTIIPRTDG